jgi:ribonucleoside-diphosphate reductase alpha chain
MENPLKTPYQQYIALSRYARWIEEKGRRETWAETVDRYIAFFASRFSDVDSSIFERLRDDIYTLKVMPSMRALMTAGKALEESEVAAYNCAYIAIDYVRAFDEILYVLMNGTGVGFSVERQYVSKLPEIPDKLYATDSVITVADSKRGWAVALKELIALLYSGQIPKWDTSKVRPAGSRLKTFGGRASGPAPLEAVFRFCVELFKRAAGRKLSSIECHDLVCKIAECVVVGGVRRSALISLSNLSDDRMRNAKTGQWWIDNPQRSLANNSVAYTERPDIGIFMSEWLSLYNSKSGERGIFNRQAAENLIPERRKEFNYVGFGTNPCSEIVLRSNQFCNLTEVIVRHGDTIEDLMYKVESATILGTMQSTLTNFKYLNKRWKENCEEERLLGVSLTGIMDHEWLSSDWCSDHLYPMKKHAIKTNEEWATKLGINKASAITCVKPSGTVSQLVDSASGIHPRYSPYYIRTVRADKKDPLAQYMRDAGVPCEDDVMRPDSTYVFSFPVKAPEGTTFRDDVGAIQQLELWKDYQRNWCEHKPSITVYVKEHEWMEVGAWVWENFDIVSGVSFLPHSDHTYQQAPYQEITEEQYHEAVAKFPTLDWSKLGEYEKDDCTEGMQTLACTGGQCEL